MSIATHRWTTRRNQRRAAAELHRDLATFSTPAELLELSSLLRRHDDRVAEPIRRIVDWAA